MDRQAYLDRKGERLVVQGFRHRLSGYEFGETACWGQAWSLFTDELGAVNAGALVTHSHFLVKAIREKAAEPVRCLTCQCRYLCREERLCVGMIAALQHGDEASPHYPQAHLSATGRKRSSPPQDNLPLSRARTAQGFLKSRPCDCERYSR